MVGGDGRGDDGDGQGCDDVIDGVSGDGGGECPKQSRLSYLSPSSWLHHHRRMSSPFVAASSRMH